MVKLHYCQPVQTLFLHFYVVSSPKAHFKQILWMIKWKFYIHTVAAVNYSLPHLAETEKKTLLLQIIVDQHIGGKL